jgi:transposase InsO family protein
LSIARSVAYQSGGGVHRGRVGRTIVAWPCATSKDVELVMNPLRMATWQRQREGVPSCQGSIGHADAGSQYTSIRLAEHLEPCGHPPVHRHRQRCPTTP